MDGQASKLQGWLFFSKKKKKSFLCLFLHFRTLRLESVYVLFFLLIYRGLHFTAAELKISMHTPPKFSPERSGRKIQVHSLAYMSP